MGTVDNRIFRSEIPKGARMLTKAEACDHQYHIVYNWKPWTDVWPFKIGRALLIGSATASGIYINHWFRRKLKMRTYGFVPTMLSLAFIPGFMTGIFHTQIVIPKIMLFQISCPYCLTTKSAGLQTFSGVFLPLLLSPMANLALATSTGRHNVPYPSDVKEIIKMLHRAYSPIYSKLTLLFIFHMLLATFITEKQIKSFLNVQDKLYFLNEDEKHQLMHK